MTDSKPLVNPCAVSNGGCSHFCLLGHLPTGSCACPIGVRLLKDGKTCEPEGIKQGYDASPSSQFLMDVDYDPVEGFVYWIDATDVSIKRCRLNGSNAMVVTREGVTSGAYTLRVDVVGRNLYWVDRSVIYIVKLDGSLQPRLLVGRGLLRPHGFALDYGAGVMYVSDWQDNCIYKIDMDGTNPSTLISLGDYSYPNGLDIDTEEKRIYWTESNHSLIRSVDLSDMSDIRHFDLINKISQPYSISKIGNRIFCNSMASRSFAEITLENETDAHTYHVLDAGVLGLFGLRAVDLRPNSALKKEYACGLSIARCQHYCVPLPGKRFRCLCSAGFELNSDGHSCNKPSAYAITLDHENPKDLVRISLGGGSTEEPLFLQGVRGNIISMDFDREASTLYIASQISDTEGCIQKTIINGTVRRLATVIEGCALSGITALAVDSASKNVFWVNSQMGTVEVVERRGRFKRTIAWNGITPTNIAVHSSAGQVFISNRRNNTIMRMPLSGSRSGGEVVVSGSETILCFTIDDTDNKIYWSEKTETGSTVYVARLSGADRSVFYALASEKKEWPSRIISIYHHEANLYYLDTSKSMEFGRIDENGPHVLQTGVTCAVFLIASTEPEFRREMRSPCEKSNGGCIELCLPTSELDGGKEVHRVHQNRRCKCRDHYEVDPDTNKCEAPKAAMVIGTSDRFIRLKVVTREDGKKDLHENPPVILPIERVFIPLSIVVDIRSQSHTIYWVDGGNAQVLSIAYELLPSTAKSQSLSVAGCHFLRSLALHIVTRQLYVSCVDENAHSHVVVYHIKEAERLLFVGRVVDGSRPVGMPPAVIVPREVAVLNGHLVYIDIGKRSGKPVLVLCKLDGTNCQEVIEQPSISVAPMHASSDGGLLFYSTPSAVYAFTPFTWQSATVLLMPFPVHRFLFVPLAQTQAAYTDIYSEQAQYIFDKVSRQTLTLTHLSAPTLQHTVYSGLSIVLDKTEVPLGGLGTISALTFYDEKSMGNAFAADLCARLNCSHLCMPGPIGRMECACPLGWNLAVNKESSCSRASPCGARDFRCEDQLMCIHVGRKCDGRVDCKDGSDESSAVCDGSSPDAWRCTDGFFIDKYLVCDGTRHCSDGSDEKKCRCSAQEMDCALWGQMSKSACLSRSLRCDGHADCANGADEDERLCLTFPVPSTLARMHFRFWYMAAVVLLVTFICLVTCVFLTKCCTNRGHSMDNYHMNTNTEASILLPHEEPSRAFEMTVRTYSVVESTSTYHTLPPPVASQSGCSMEPERVGYSRLPVQSAPSDSVVEIPLDRFYAPPPSAASLSTYGIVIPAQTDTLGSGRSAAAHSLRLQSHRMLMAHTPPPAYSQSSSLRRPYKTIQGTPLASSSPMTARRPRVRGAHPDRCSSCVPGTKAVLRSKKRAAQVESREETSFSSSSLSSHSSEERPSLRSPVTQKL